MLRAENVERLRRQHFDLIVVGGGINGCAIARDAVLRGLKTALVEKGDFASGTSSRTSKMIHGGFRYMEQGHFGLVHEAVSERDRLRRRLAPGLVRPLPFLFPMYRDSRAKPWMMRMGMAIYDALAAFRNVDRHKMLPTGEALEWAPGLRTEGLLASGLFYDCSMDDARLTLTVLRSASEFGLVAANYLRVVRFTEDRSRVTGVVVQDGPEGQEFSVRGRMVVNAAGPWVDDVQRLVHEPEHLLRKTKGIHLIVPKETFPLRCAVGMAHPGDRRLMFAVPWESAILVGTTDTDYQAAAEDAYATPKEVDYLLEAIHHYFPGVLFGKDGVMTTYSGVRPLAASEDPRLKPSQVSREEVIRVGSNGVLSVAGGKFTTHRRISEKVLDMICRRTDLMPPVWARKRSRTTDVPLFPPDELLRASTTERLDHLLHRYGTRAGTIIRTILENPDSGRPLVSGLPYTWAEIDHAIREEMAETLIDVLYRRLPLALVNPAASGALAPAVAARMAELKGWTKGEIQKQVGDFTQEIDRNRACLRES
ncbi:MAG: glycerol-3-phosphate dehydrogenase/oxidase [Nitrospirae bacterium]|nr:glycerol-3-phosphate dehydrogenase/oxidase [Nitrospirota bacterium]